MSFFGLIDKKESFKLFSTPHITAISTILIICILIYIYRKQLRERTMNFRFRIILATILTIQQLSYFYWHIFNGTWSLKTALPFNICGASVVMSVVLLITMDKKIFDVLYFWGICGTLQALITPSMDGYNFPHYRFFQFFIGHGLIVITIIFMITVNKYKVNFESLKKSFITVNVFAVFIGVFNYFTGANYLFLRHKPDSASLMDMLGNWPWYIVSLEIIAIVFFMIAYIPFRINKIIDIRKENYEYNT